MISYLFVLGVVAGTLAAPQDVSNKLSPRLSFEVSTPDIAGMIVPSITNVIDQTASIGKDINNLGTSTVKEGVAVGSVAVGKGMDVAKAGVGALTDVGKAGLNLGLGVAEKGLGILGKVGGLIPGAGSLVTGGANLGIQGVQGIKTAGNSLLDRINGGASTVLTGITDGAQSGSDMVGKVTDNVESTINAGLDAKSGMATNLVTSVAGMIPTVTIGGKFEVNGK